MADTHFTPNPERIQPEFAPTQRTKTHEDLVARFWAKVGPPDENGCRPWLAAKTRGYGVLHVDGKMVKAHAFAWRITYHGPTMPGHEVFRHLCDRPDCVEPSHVVPGTHAENIAERDERGRGRWATGPRPAARKPKPDGFGATRQGEKNPSAKLTADDVQAIRKARAEGRTLESIGRYFGVTATTVSRVCSQKQHGGWASLDGTPNVRKRISAETVAAVRQRIAQGARQHEVAAEFGLSQQHVGRIASGQSWGK